MLYHNPAIQSRVEVHLVEEAKGGPSKLLLSFLFWFLGSRTGRTERRTDMFDGSNDAVWRKEVLLGGLVSMQKTCWGPNSPENT
jgi:hypothetical protein